MSRQQSFLPEPEPQPPYQRHSDTSREAAAEIEESAGTLRAKVYRFICYRSLHGATDEEMQSACGMNPSTQRPRRIELVAKGLVRDSGRKRQTSSGRLAVVWEVVR